MSAGAEPRESEIWVDAAARYFSGEHTLFSHFRMQVLTVVGNEIRVRAILPDFLADRDRPETIHGGGLTIILDTVFGFAVISRVRSLQPIATVNLKTEHVGKGRPGATVECRAECHAVRSSIGFARGEVIDGSTGELLATATGAFMIGTKGPDFRSMNGVGI